MLLHSNKFLPLVKFIYENKNTQNDSVRIKPCGDVYLISHYLKLFLFIHPLNKKKTKYKFSCKLSSFYKTIFNNMILFICLSTVN